MPTLLNKRVKAAACTLGYNLYVFGGTNEEGIFIDVIERLTLVQYGLPKAGWVEIDCDGAMDVKWDSPAVAPLNDYIILIMGGYNGMTRRSDIYEFNISTEECTKKINDCKLSFASPGNQIAVIGEGNVFVLAEADKTWNNLLQCMVKYTNGEPQVN